VSRSAQLVAALALLGALGLAGCGHCTEPAVERGGQTVPAFAQPGNGKPFGFSDSVFSASSSFNPAAVTASETVAAARAAGATSHRLVYAWRLAEPERGVWDPDYTAAIARVASAFPRRTLVVLAFAPRWANPEADAFCPEDADCLFPPARSELPAWEAYVRKAARAFPQSDLEIWNEPNLSAFWRPAVDPTAYMELVASAARVVRKERAAGRSTARVVVGALAQAPDSGTESRTPWGFLEDLYDAGLAGTYEALSWHTYPYEEDEGSLSRGSSFARDWKHVREVVRRQDPGARFWVTETGVTTTGAGSCGDEATDAAAANQLAALTRRLLRMPDVDALYVHTLFEPASYPPDDRERGFGVVEAPERGVRRPKPGFCAVARVAGAVHRACVPGKPWPAA
jgi:polysaccharide biosynthesis protein PslG